MATSTRNISNITLTHFGNSPTHIQTAAMPIPVTYISTPSVVTSTSTSEEEKEQKKKRTETTQLIPGNGCFKNIGGGSLADGLLGRLLELILQARVTGKKKVLTMPDELLYNDIGLGMWTVIINQGPYYQKRDEMDLIQKKSELIASYIPNDAYLFDIGAGNMEKVSKLLDRLKAIGRVAHYLGLDISDASLDENLRSLAGRYTRGSVTMSGLYGTFKMGVDYCLKFLQSKPRVFLSLGSVLFNEPRDDAVDFLRMWAVLVRPGDRIIAGMDGHHVVEYEEKVWNSYHSPKNRPEDKTHDNLFKEFFQNGLKHANQLLGDTEQKELHGLFKLDDWEIKGELETGDMRHRFYLKANKNVCDTKGDLVFEKGCELDWFDAHKRTIEDVEDMCKEVGLVVVDNWALPGSEMRQYLIVHKDDELVSKKTGKQ